MTRPSFLYLLPIYLLFWILRFFFNKEEKKQVIIGLISCATCAIALLGYCGLVKVQHGEFSISSISYINNVVTVIKSGAYKNASNKEMVKVVDEVLGEEGKEYHYWFAFSVLYKQFSVDDLKEFISSSLNGNTGFLIYLINRSIKIGALNIGASPYIILNQKYINPNYGYIGNLILPINFSFVYFVISSCIVYLIWNLAKNKKIDWVVAFFSSVIIGNLVTLIVGAPSESQRLFLSSVPIFLLLFGKILTINQKKIKLLESGKQEKQIKKV